MVANENDIRQRELACRLVITHSRGSSSPCMKTNLSRNALYGHMGSESKPTTSTQLGPIRTADAKCKQREGKVRANLCASYCREGPPPGPVSPAEAESWAGGWGGWRRCDRCEVVP